MSPLSPGLILNPYQPHARLSRLLTQCHTAACHELLLLRSKRCSKVATFAGMANEDKGGKTG
jgi:hypothetical protein